MSELRQIMERLHRRSAGSGSPPLAPAAELPFRDELQHCSDAMLQYEWSWLSRHEEGLSLCRSSDTMTKAAGGPQQLERLIQQAHTYRDELQALFCQRGLAPQQPSNPVEPSEHAWDLSHAALREAWGIEQPS